MVVFGGLRVVGCGRRVNSGFGFMKFAENQNLRLEILDSDESRPRILEGQVRRMP